MNSLAGQQVYRVRHHYRYVYTDAITKVKQRLIMVPPDQHRDQTLISFDMDVRGTSGPLTIDWQIDRFGNRVCRIEAERVEHALDFEARFSVRRGQPEPPHPQSLAAYLEFTALTAADPRIRAAAQAIALESTSPARRAELAHDWAAGAIGYQLGVTGTQTPAAMALHLGKGVCQDFAHIMLALLRSLDVPARYVSGHLLGEGAPHAWVEVLLDDSVVAFDPTHHRRAEKNYITVATGRDFADVTPTSGVFSGAATGRLHWNKQAQILEGAAEVAA